MLCSRSGLQCGRLNQGQMRRLVLCAVNQPVISGVCGSGGRPSAWVKVALKKKKRKTKAKWQRCFGRHCLSWMCNVNNRAVCTTIRSRVPGWKLKWGTGVATPTCFSWAKFPVSGKPFSSALKADSHTLVYFTCPRHIFASVEVVLSHCLCLLSCS